MTRAGSSDLWEISFSQLSVRISRLERTQRVKCNSAVRITENKMASHTSINTFLSGINSTN